MMSKKHIPSYYNCVISILCTVLLSVHIALFAQTKVIHSVTGNGGGNITSPSLKAVTAIGQQNIGTHSNASVTTRNGFIHLLASKKSAQISGAVFRDINGDGIQSSYENNVSAWKIILGGSKQETTYTNENGQFIFRNLPAGNYTVSEIIPDGWIQTSPSVLFYSVHLSLGEKTAGIVFGNIPYGTSDGGDRDRGAHTICRIAA